MTMMAKLMVIGLGSLKMMGNLLPVIVLLGVAEYKGWTKVVLVELGFAPDRKKARRREERANYDY